MKQLILLFINLLFATLVFGQSCAIELIVDQDHSCYDMFYPDGAAHVEILSGQGPYTYEWANGELSQSAIMLDKGYTACTVTDALGCMAVDSVFIYEPPYLEATITLVQGVVCKDDSDGIAYVTGTGGTPPYYYLWDLWDQTDTVYTLFSGVHQLTITDVMGCSNTARVEVSFQGAEYTYTSTAESCALADGSISITATGPGPISYLWEDGSTAATLSNLVADRYEVTITDGLGCITIINEKVDPPFDFYLNGAKSDCSIDNATARAYNFDPPIANPIFEWNTGETTAEITGLSPGYYSVTVTDPAASCSYHKNFYARRESNCYATLSGNVFNDPSFPDCMEDDSTNTYGNQFVSIYKNTELIARKYVNTYGYYAINLDTGYYELRLEKEADAAYLCPPQGIAYVDIIDYNSGYSQDFYVQGPNYKDLKVNLSADFAHRPGFEVNDYFGVSNKGHVATDGSLTITHPEEMSLVSGAGQGSYDSQTRTITFDFVDLAPNDFLRFPIKFLVDVNTPLGTELSITAAVTTADDFIPSNNMATEIVTVVGSYDPNDKRNLSAADPFGGDIDPSVTAYDYQIRFQNTGTFTAYTVVVKDELPPELDLLSIRNIVGSHDFRLEIEEERTLVFFFDNIMLPDSNANEPRSHGFIDFTIDVVPDLPLGTSIENDAAIYFDFNEPVITNTVVNTLAEPNAIGTTALSFDFSVQPNPLQGNAFIDLQLEQKTTVSMQLFDAQGRVVVDFSSQQSLGEGQHLLPFAYEHLSAGVYFLKLETESGSLTRKVVRF